MIQTWHNAQGEWRCINAYDLATNKYVFIIEDESGNTQFLGSYATRSIGEAAFVERMKEQNRAYCA